MQKIVRLARNFIFVFLRLAIAFLSVRAYSFTTMKSLVSTIVQTVKAIISEIRKAGKLTQTPRKTIVLKVREQHYKGGNFSKLFVYVADPTLSRVVSHLTGTLTLRPRHLMALHSLGYNFHLPRPVAVTVPAWLPKYLVA